MIRHTQYLSDSELDYLNQPSKPKAAGGYDPWRRWEDRVAYGLFVDEGKLKRISSEYTAFQARADVVYDAELDGLVVPADPNGIAQHAPGAKLDSGKLRPALVLGDFSRALKAVAEIGTFGANKYTDHGWLSVPNGIERYEEAGERHRLDRRTGVPLDPESKFKHLAHEAWNILAQLELTLRKEQA